MNSKLHVVSITLILVRGQRVLSFFGKEAFIIALKKIGFSKVVKHSSHEGSLSRQS